MDKSVIFATYIAAPIPGSRFDVSVDPTVR